MFVGIGIGIGRNRYGTGGTPVGLLLDNYSGAAAAYSLRKLSNTYSGSAIQVRRESDDETLDIGFVGGELDTNTLETFVNAQDVAPADYGEGAAAAYSLRYVSDSYGGFVIGARRDDNDTSDFTPTQITDGTLATWSQGGNVYVHTWYDQSGNGRDASQTTASAQPQIVSGGNVITENGKPALNFDGTNDGMITSYATSGDFSVWYISRITDNTEDRSVVNSWNNTSRHFLFWYDRVTDDNLYRNYVYTSLNNFNALNVSSYDANTNLIGHIVNSTTQYFVKNGGTPSTGSGGSGSGGVSYLAIGFEIQTNSKFFAGPIQEIIYYPSDQTSNRGNIETEINSYYNIYTSTADGFVTTWYDQSGNGNDASNTTASEQPQIVSSGSTIVENGKPCVQFDGSDDILESGTTSTWNFLHNGDTNFVSIVLKVNTNPDNAQTFFGTTGTSSSSSIGYALRYDDRSSLSRNDILFHYVYNGSSGNPSITNDGGNNSLGSGSQTLLSIQSDADNATAANRSIINVNNGSNIENNSDTNSPTISNSSQKLQIGGGSTIAEFLEGNIQEAILYPSDQSSNRTGIQTNINDFYSIYLSDADAQAFVERVNTAGGTLSDTEKQAVNTLVQDLKSAGIWSKMKAIYPMVGASAAACAQNLKSSSFTGTFTSGWTFASNGVTSNGTSAYMDSNCSYTNMSQNSVHMSVYVQNPLASLNSTFNAYDGTNTVGTYRDYAFATNSAYDIAGDPTDGDNGFLVIYRTSSTQHSRRWNNFQQTVSHNSTGVTNASPYLAARNNNGTADTFVANTYSFASQGDGLTDNEASDFYDAVQAFQTTLSRQV